MSDIRLRFPWRIHYLSWTISCHIFYGCLLSFLCVRWLRRKINPDYHWILINYQTLIGISLDLGWSASIVVRPREGWKKTLTSIKQTVNMTRWTARAMRLKLIYVKFGINKKEEWWKQSRSILNKIPPRKKSAYQRSRRQVGHWYAGCVLTIGLSTLASVPNMNKIFDTFWVRQMKLAINRWIFFISILLQNKTKIREPF